MTEIKLTITNATGLHARPAALFVQKAGSFKSKVNLSGNGKTVDAKSILGILGLGLSKGAEVVITADGEDEAACVQALKVLFESNFGEG